MKSKTNKLAKETSPYLLQHQYNPVQWFPWGAEALSLAETEDKPILVSIGYSACHWCHVMERESFENETLADLMNKNFICIKVDREERPDIDQIYMDAVQAMGLNGGWPLNVFLTPQQKPFYGGTYFPPAAWGQILENVATAYQTKRKRLEDSADNFVKAISTSDIQKYAHLISSQQEQNFPLELVEVMGKALKPNFDHKYGGMKRAPKFPMPSIWRFLLRYFYHQEEQQARVHVLRTLDGMAMGGIYDQVRGGFSRYSVDERWFAPHFEKMLYDNGQLLTLYAEAYQLFQKPLYASVMRQTINWLREELTSPENAFYSALDADSEGVEGKFYTWTHEEIEAMAGSDAPIICEYFHVEVNGNWEEGRNILYWTDSDEDFAQKHAIELSVWQEMKSNFIQKALEIRQSRIRPGLDDKVLAGWNGLMLKGLIDAYNALGDASILSLAIDNGQFIVNNLIIDNVLYRSYKGGEVKIKGYLEDYAFVAEAMIALYEATFEPKWLQVAQNLTDTVIEQFYDAEEKFFFYTSSQGEKLITRKKEVFDNVIPSSNAAIGHVLFKMGKLLDEEKYTVYAKNMVMALSQMMQKDVQYLSHWALLYCDLSTPTAEIAILGRECVQFRNELSRSYLPNKLLMGAFSEGTLPLLLNRKPIDGKTTVYVCYDKTCKLPVHTISEATMQLQ